MPRCYMVKKGLYPLEGTPPCSPPEATVAPPYYTPHNHPVVAGPRPAQYANQSRHVGTQYDESRSGDFAEKSGGESTYPRGGAITNLSDHIDQPNRTYTVLRAADYTDPQLSQNAAESHQLDYSDLSIDYSDPRHPHYGKPRSGDNAELRTVRYLERDFSSNNEPRSGDYAEARTKNYFERERWSNIEPRAAECAEPRSGDYADQRAAEYAKSHSQDYDEPRAAEYAEPRSGDCAEPHAAEYAEPRAVRYLEQDLLTYSNPRVVEYTEPRLEIYSEQSTAGYDELRSADYAEPRSQFETPRSAEYVEPRDLENDAPKAAEYEQACCTEFTERRNTEFAELQNMCSAVREYTAADTEAAHELLSLAASVPPLPPAAVLTVLSAPKPVLPVYTYTLQPANIFIITEEPCCPNMFTTTLQTLTPLQQVHFTSQPQVNAYIAYQEPMGPQPPLQYQQLYSAAEVQPPSMPLAIPVSVIEEVPTVAPLPMEQERAPLSVQVSVIEPVPISQQQPSRALVNDAISEPEHDEPAVLCLNVKKNKYTCAQCGKQYATSSNLSRHKQTHRSLESDDAKRCGECGKVYVSMAALAMHVLTHRMGHVCGVCGKQFSRPWLLRGHLRSHTGEKPYKCPSCTKSFADRSNLRAHLQTHTDDKKWECLLCKKNFALKSYLTKHQEVACSQDEQDNK